MKDLTEENQFRLINLVNKNLIKEAYLLELNFNKQGFYVMECVDRIRSAEKAGEISYKEKIKVPQWIKNIYILSKVLQVDIAMKLRKIKYKIK